DHHRSHRSKVKLRAYAFLILIARFNFIEETSELLKYGLISLCMGDGRLQVLNFAVILLVVLMPILAPGLGEEKLLRIGLLTSCVH
ncbi:hypothetical protein MKX01_020178, partial [Papaver californicum]